MRAVRPGNDHEDGAAAVEFALVAPLLFMILFAIIQYGLGFFQYQAASSTVRDAARTAALGINDCTGFATGVRDHAVANGMPTDAVRSVSVSPVPTVTPMAVDVAVTYRLSPLNLPLVPFPSDPVTARARVPIDQLGAVSGVCTWLAP